MGHVTNPDSQYMVHVTKPYAAQGTNYTDALTLKGVSNIFGLHTNLFMHPW
jgi:hypothetical protein